jgi:hypothetical protein
LRYPEGRSIVLQNLSLRQRAKILSDIPSTYMRTCLREFWKMKITPKGTEGVGSESPWHGYRYMAKATNAIRTYGKNVMEIIQISDLWNRETNRPFTWIEWRKMVKKFHQKNVGTPITGEELIRKADTYHEIGRAIPRQIRVELLKTYKYAVPPKPGTDIYLIKGENLIWPAVAIDNNWAQRVRIDGTGKAHRTQTKVRMRPFDILEALKWKNKWAGPAGANLALDSKWKIAGKIEDFRGISISALTNAKTAARFKPPGAEENWKKYGLDVEWSKTWKLRPMFTAPRDSVAILRVQHRTLRVAKHGGYDSDKCLARGCGEVENQIHLVTCRHIKNEFWKPIRDIMVRLGLAMEDFPNNLTQEEHTRLWIAEQWWDEEKGEAIAIGRETAALIHLAWRCLYAETVGARLDERELRLDFAVWKTVRLLLSRVKAYGAKWRKWFMRQRGWRPGKVKMIPEKHREYALIKSDECGSYVINTELQSLLTELIPRRRGRRDERR